MNIDQDQPGAPNGAANGADTPPAEPPQQSLREIAEAAWDEVEAGSQEGQEPPPVDEGGQQRDAAGRFVAKTPEAKPGEQSEPPADPAPKKDQAPSEATPADPARGSNQPPQHWSEQDRQIFAKQSPEAQEWLLRRHTEMERDYQSKAQANATAVQFTNALAPVFQDPTIAGSLQQTGLSPFDAITQWAAFHKRFYTDPAGLLQELGQRAGLNPAANGQMSQPGQGPAVSEADLKDPTIRSFADYLGKTFQDVQALRNELHQMRQQDADRQSAASVEASRWAIDNFAAEKDAQGNLMHPHFDAVLPQILDLLKANPDRDFREAYETAVWMVPEIRSGLLAAQQNQHKQQEANQRAKLAVRSNTRGITSPVSKPSPQGEAKGLRATIEAAADELGM